MPETFVADSWLYAVLNGDTTLIGLAPGGVHGHLNQLATKTFPYVLYQIQAPGADVGGVGPHRFMAQALYLVRGICETMSYAGAAASIADRIDVLLHAKSGTAAGGVVVACVREQPFALIETPPGGAQYRHLGGIYRLFLQ